MTKEETIRTMADYVRKGVQSLESALAEAYEQGQLAPHWISVEDELHHGGVYLFCNSNGDVFIASDEIGSLYKNVTHWMRIEPPAVLSNLERTGKNELLRITTYKKQTNGYRDKQTEMVLVVQRQDR